MCLTGGKPTDPGTWEEFRDAALAKGGDETRVTKADYDTALKRWQGSDEYKTQQEEAKSEIEVAKAIEAEKTAELKAKTTEAAISATTPPVSTMEADSLAKKRQKELSVGVDDVAASDSAFTPPVEVPTLLSMAQSKKFNKSVLRRRSRKKGRRSLITGTSGGGIGYYSKFFT